MLAVKFRNFQFNDLFAQAMSPHLISCDDTITFITLFLTLTTISPVLFAKLRSIVYKLLKEIAPRLEYN